MTPKYLNSEVNLPKPDQPLPFDLVIVLLYPHLTARAANCFTVLLIDSKVGYKYLGTTLLRVKPVRVWLSARLVFIFSPSKLLTRAS